MHQKDTVIELMLVEDAEVPAEALSAEAAPLSQDRRKIDWVARAESVIECTPKIHAFLASS